MADFGGWMMPIEYPGAGVLAEHTAVRERVGLFDVSHLGKVLVKGPGALTFLNAHLTNDLERIVDGQAQYTMLCTSAGGVIDDLIAYRKSADELFLIPNAANTADVVAALQKSVPADISIENLHESYGVLALQGPRSAKVLASLGVQIDLAYMAFAEVTIGGAQVILCRTGYTGEFGFEILPLKDDASAIWDLLARAVTDFDGLICGLGARDTLRTEMGYPLHGHELSLEISPNQAAAAWAVGWGKKEFAGHQFLQQERIDGPTKILRGLQLTDQGIPRAGMNVKSISGSEIGEVTSGTFSPSLRKGIALALLAPHFNIGDEVTIDLRGRAVSAVVVKLPMVESHVR